jgi:hypothetical protein
MGAACGYVMRLIRMLDQYIFHKGELISCALSPTVTCQERRHLLPNIYSPEINVILNTINISSFQVNAILNTKIYSVVINVLLNTISISSLQVNAVLNTTITAV